MSTTTTNYGLTKPATTDVVDITVLNGDFDIIDAALKANISASSNTIVLIGDSYTANSGGVVGNPSYTARGFWTWAQVFMGHRFETLANLGVGGYTSAQILATLPAALALNPSWIHYQAGTNDVGSAYASSVTIANDLLAIAACKAAGVKLIIGTIPNISTYTTGQKNAAAQINAWRRAYCRKNLDVILVDYAAVLNSQTLGYIAGDYTFDGAHPSVTGAFYMGKLLASVLTPLVPATNRLTSGALDSTNLLGTAGMFLGTGGNQTGLATNWISPGTATFTQPARTDGYPGYWMQAVVAAGAGTYMAANATVNGTTLSVGDTIMGLVEVDVSGLEASPAPAVPTGVSLKLQSYHGGFTNPISDLFVNPGAGWENAPTASWSGVLETPTHVVPALTDIEQLVISFTGGGTYKAARATILNLTTLATLGS